MNTDNLIALAIIALGTAVVVALTLGLKRSIDRDAAEAAEDERRVWRELRRAVRGFSQATSDFSAAVGDNVAAQRQHCEVMGTVGASIENIEARRRLH